MFKEDNMQLQGKVALITGGGGGIGAAIAERFVHDGARVCISGRRQEGLDGMARTLPSGTVATCAGDVSKDEDAARMVKTTIDFGGRIDVLVNNAAINAAGSLVDTDRAVWRKGIDVNLIGPFVLMQEAIPPMIKNGGGSIINIASGAGIRALANHSAYCTSKAALIMLTQQAALDYGPQKIRVNAVCPGVVKTPMSENDLGDIAKTIGMDKAGFFEMLAKMTPLQRFAEPAEISGICAFLASDDSSFMTGAAIAIDAGTTVVDVIGAGIMAALRRYYEQR